MTGKPLRLICVGKLKTPFWKDAAAHYIKRIRFQRPLQCVEVRDGDAPLAPPQRITLEGRKILELLPPQEIALALDEQGQPVTSRQFAHLLQKLDNGAQGRVCFVVGGAYGLDNAVRERAARLISLSPMTLPHELARVLLLEQIYRAECILRNSPYHH
ncbi:MAG: 23S rRNA (pseudouridine(1915)-N(3))-methyltransferase RlmH [Desulfovibrio sp.]|jgi:23S rRNA (pseudouridine1915-N3)-methyltransferase|nr:23S rRNA (pseudouridine(1915)-N(3))-methyltransferase RlmH [Desulfovibrio sp.]